MLKRSLNPFAQTAVGGPVYVSLNWALMFVGLAALGWMRRQR